MSDQRNQNAPSHPQEYLATIKKIEQPQFNHQGDCNEEEMSINAAIAVDVAANKELRD